MLHFRATPEEKERIKENAGHAEVALSTWMRAKSLDYEDRLNPTQPAVWDCCGASRDSGKHAENCPLIVQQDAEADSTQPAVDGVPLDVGDRISNATPRPEGGIYKVTSVGETYEQFMERRVGELVGDSPTLASQDAATGQAEREWAER